MFTNKSRVFLTVVIIMTLIVGLCGVIEAAEIKDLIIGGGGVGGSWYLCAAQISELIRQGMPGISVSVVEGGAIANVRLTNEGRDMDIGMASLPDVLTALSNKGVFEGENIDNIAPVINFATDSVQFTVLVKSGIDSIADLADKRILPGPKGWGIEAITQQVLALYGLSYDSIKANGGGVSHVTWGEAPSLIKDGHADMVGFKGAVPLAQTLEIEATNKAKVLGLDEEKLNEFLVGKPGYFKGNIPAGSYKGQTEDALTISHTSVIFVNKDLPEDVVYNILKLIMENSDKLNQIEGLNIGKEPLLGIDPSLLHPGAKKYYEEAGILK